MCSLTRAEVRDLDRRAIEEYGLPGIVLMENAGRGCADLIDGGPVVICCGRGNNGGDGFVMARHLDLRGIPVEIFLVCDPAELRGDARINAEVVLRSRIPLTVASRPEDWAAARSRMAGSRWIVDALLGTGFTGEPREPYATAIRLMNSLKGSGLTGPRILAVDVPSGLDADTGIPAADCVQAHITATFVAQKTGFSAPTALPSLGEVRVIGIGAPRRLLTSCGVVKE